MIDILPTSSYALCNCHSVQRVNILSRNFSDVLLADTHLNECGEQAAAELVCAMAGTAASVHAVCLPIQLQPCSLHWYLVLFFYLGSELC